MTDETTTTGARAETATEAPVAESTLSETSGDAASETTADGAEFAATLAPTDDELQSDTPAPAAAETPADLAIPAAPTLPATPPAPSARPMSSGTTRGLSYAVDIVFCIDVTGSMTPILDTVKDNALRFYDDVQANLVEKGKNVDQLRVRVVAFRDFQADADTAVLESSFFPLPEERTAFDQFVKDLVPEGGGDAPESGLEAVALAINSPWTSRGDRRRQVIVVWTDQPARPLDPSVLPPGLSSSVPANFSALTDLWEDPQGALGPSSKRLILFAPDGPGWSDISANWENVVHHPSQAGGGLSDVDYLTIIDSIGNSV
jgi:von Willebrand factor type A domain